MESDELDEESDFEELLLELLPESPPDELLLLSDDEDDEDEDESPELLLSFFLSLKSVSYQPVPFSWKLGADRSFFSALAPHSGQSRNGSSLIFCSASNWCSH